MLKGELLRGSSIVAYNTGTQIDTVEDVIFDQYTNRIMAFSVPSNRRLYVLPWSGVKAVHPHQVVAWSKSMIVDAAELFDIRQIVERHNLRRGMPIHTTTGQFLGTMMDVYFDELTGFLEGYAVVGGEFADSDTAHSFVPAPRTIAITNDAAIVPSGLVAQMQAREVDIRDKLVQHNAVPVDGVVAVWVERVIALVDGYRARCDVETSEGSLVIASGQIVTEAVIRRVQDLQEEQALLEAVGVDIDAVMRDMGHG